MIFLPSLYFADIKNGNSSTGDKSNSNNIKNLLPDLMVTNYHLL